MQGRLPVQVARRQQGLFPVFQRQSEKQTQPLASEVRLKLLLLQRVLQADLQDASVLSGLPVWAGWGRGTEISRFPERFDFVLVNSRV